MRNSLVIAMLLSGCTAHLRIPGPLTGMGRGGAPVVAAAVRELPDSPDPTTYQPDDAIGRRRASDRRKRLRAAGRAIASAARHYLDHSLDGYRNDCSGFVTAASDRAGFPITGNTASMWEFLQEDGATHHRKEPHIGDLIFFDNTYDRNRDGRLNDTLTHIAVVLDVNEDGTILFAQAGVRGGPNTMEMNLHFPRDHRAADGEMRNDYLRRRRSSDRPGTPHLTGEMWRGFATLP